MNFEKLLAEKKIERVEKTDINLKLAEKDIEFAKKGLATGNYSRVMSVVYEGVLRASMQLMNFFGYRAIGKEHHKNIFEFFRVLDFDDDLINYFDYIRKKRNDFIYRNLDIISKNEAEEIIIKAEKFVQEIRTFVQKNRTFFKSDKSRIKN